MQTTRVTHSYIWSLSLVVMISTAGASADVVVKRHSGHGGRGELKDGTYGAHGNLKFQNSSPYRGKKQLHDSYGLNYTNWYQTAAIDNFCPTRRGQTLSSIKIKVDYMAYLRLFADNNTPNNAYFIGQDNLTMQTFFPDSITPISPMTWDYQIKLGNLTAVDQMMFVDFNSKDWKRVPPFTTVDKERRPTATVTFKSNDPAFLRLFTCTNDGKVRIPVSAGAWTSETMWDGSGMGSETMAGFDLTVYYCLNGDDRTCAAGGDDNRDNDDQDDDSQEGGDDHRSEH